MAQAQRREPRGFHPIASPIGTVFAILGVAVLGLMLSLALEWIGMGFVWPEQGAEHSHRMLQTELGYLNEDFRRSLYGAPPIETARAISAWVYQISGMAWLIDWLTGPALEGRGVVAEQLRAVVVRIGEYIEAAAYITQLYGVRIAVALLSLHAFFLFSAVALVDGLVMRDLRKFGGGLESAYVFHRILPFAKPTIWLALVVYLALPVSLHPNWIFLPAYTLFALLLAHLAARFKKFL